MSNRRYPSTIGGVCYLLVLTLAVLSLVVVATGHWRIGVDQLAVSIICAAVARGVLPDSEAGMLEVRAKWLDVPLLLTVGGLLIWLAASIPQTG